MGNNFIIGIAGASGVGKTTIAKLFSYLYKNEESMILSGDDLHKWDRTSKNWLTMTHLNPEANMLALGYNNLKALKNGESIIRKEYNHNTGTFDEAKVINPTPVIIYEGLHALYDNTSDLIDLKVYIDTDKELTEEWKLRRDTAKRGYSEEEVKDIIKRRKIDQDKFINHQKEKADIIIKFSKNDDGEIELYYNSNRVKDDEIIRKVRNTYDLFEEFLRLCKLLSTDLSLTQESGGNVSIKYDDKLLIKASGYKMSQVNMNNGFVICNTTNSNNEFKTEDEYNQFIQMVKFKGDKQPSMELGFHNYIKSRIVIHTHPIYLNCILSSNESRPIIEKLFYNLDYEYIEYTLPGFKLCNKFITNNKKKIYFLENHGLIIGCDNINEGFELTTIINDICKKWIDTHIDSFVDIKEVSDNTKPLLPDAAVFNNELKNVNNYILNLINLCSLTPKFLTDNEINEIMNLNSEKLRKELL